MMCQCQTRRQISVYVWTISGTRFSQRSSLQVRNNSKYCRMLNFENGGPAIACTTSYNRIWRNDQCERMLGILTQSAENCVTRCQHMRRCNVVAWSRRDKDCIMWACNNPVPAPTHIDDDYTGYQLNRQCLKGRGKGGNQFCS